MKPLVVLAAWALASSAFAAQFTTNQSASVVLGQPDFTSGLGSSGLPNRLKSVEGVALDQATGKI